MSERAWAFTVAQKVVLDLLGRGCGAFLQPELDEALGQLVAAGLVAFRDPLTPILTASGWRAFDRLEACVWG